MSESDLNFIEALDLKIWRTKGARFNAYRRTLKKQDILTYVTSFSSVHLIIIATLQLSNIVPLSQNQTSWLSLITIALSIIILVYGLIEGGKEYGKKAERYHACGKDLDVLYNQLLIAKENKNDNYAKKIAKY